MFPYPLASLLASSWMNPVSTPSSSSSSSLHSYPHSHSPTQHSHTHSHTHKPCPNKVVKTIDHWRKLKISEVPVVDIVATTALANTLTHVNHLGLIPNMLIGATLGGLVKNYLGLDHCDHPHSHSHSHSHSTTDSCHPHPHPHPYPHPHPHPHSSTMTTYPLLGIRSNDSHKRCRN